MDAREWPARWEVQPAQTRHISTFGGHLASLGVHREPRRSEQPITPHGQNFATEAFLSLTFCSASIDPPHSFQTSPVDAKPATFPLQTSNPPLTASTSAVSPYFFTPPHTLPPNQPVYPFARYPLPSCLSQHSQILPSRQTMYVFLDIPELLPATSWPAPIFPAG